jgi:hypothetical protein
MGLWDSLKDAAVNAMTQGAAQAVAGAAQASVQAKAAAATPHDRTTQPIVRPASGGVSLEVYAELLALMSDVGEDEAACLEIAARHGVGRDDWEAARAGWTARFSDPSLENRVSHAFLGFYNPALERKRGGQPPMSIEQFTRVFAETSFRRDPNDPSKQIDRQVVLAEHGLTLSKWNEALVYWSPRVSDQNDPVFRSYGLLLRAETERLTGAG